MSAGSSCTLTLTSFTDRSLSILKAFAAFSMLHLRRSAATPSMQTRGRERHIIRRRRSLKLRGRCMRSIRLKRSRDSMLARRTCMSRRDALRNSWMKHKRKVASEFALSLVCPAQEKLWSV